MVCKATQTAVLWMSCKEQASRLSLVGSRNQSVDGKPERASAGVFRFALDDIDGAHAVWNEALAQAPSAFADNPARLEEVRNAIRDPVASLKTPLQAGSYDE